MYFDQPAGTTLESTARISESKPEATLPSSVQPPKISLEFAGSPAIGKVNIIKQIHSIKSEDHMTTRKIGLYQKEILNQLIRTQPHRHIFLEGLQTDFKDCNSKEFRDYCFNELTHWDYLLRDTSADNCVQKNTQHFCKLFIK